MSFVIWALRRTASGFRTGIQNTNLNFQELLRSSPGLAVVLWAVGSGGLTAVAVLIALAFTSGIGIVPVVTSLVAIACVAYLMANVIATMYAAYQQEQEELINILRNRE